MSGLEVRSGGPHSVETAALIAEAVRLAAVAHLVEGWAFRATALRVQAEQAATSDPADRAWGAAIDLDTAQAGFASAARTASDLSMSLGLSATRYAMAEGLVAGLVEAGRRVAAGLVGIAAAGMVVPAASAAAIALGPAAVGGAALSLTPDADRYRAAIGSVLAERGLPILSDAAFVGLVRVAADQADEFLAGVFRMQGLFAIGSELDAPENAGLLLAASGVVGILAGSRGLRETSVSEPVRAAPPDRGSPGGRGEDGPGRPLAAAPVSGIADLADRIPPSDAGGPQVRIERYDAADGPRWIVYSAGTADFGTIPGEEPYDMTANLHGVAGASVLHDLVGLPSEAAASERALRASMAEAGVQAGDPVIVVGHSAGGMVAANVAADPDLDVVAAVSFGGPVAQVKTGDTPLLSVAHGEDLVPATSGSGVAAAGRVEVGRSLGALEPGPGEAIPAHAMERYRETARLIDRDDDPRLAEFRELVTDFTAGSAPADVSYWRTERTRE